MAHPGTMSNVTVSGTKLSPEEAYDVEKDLSYYCMDADLEDQIDDEEQTNGNQYRLWDDRCKL